MIDYSIVIPVYYNEGAISSTMSEITTEVLSKNPSLRGEVIFVDDGSGDGSLEELLDIRKKYPGVVKVIKLTRNFGQVHALMAGFRHAEGKCTVAMSADGQDPAGLINDMLTAHNQDGYEVVILTREDREESTYRVWTSRLFYALMKRLSFPQMPPGGFDFVLLGRRALDALRESTDPQPFLQGQILWFGFKTKFIGYRREERKVGQSRWTFGRKVTYLIDGIVGYSYVPIRSISLLGIITACLGFLYSLVILFSHLVVGNPVKGWAPIMIVILIMGGLQMLMLGTIGEYVWRTLWQVRNQKNYVIDTVYEKEQ